jgi:hypothetical protein
MLLTTEAVIYENKDEKENTPPMGGGMPGGMGGMY